MEQNNKSRKPEVEDESVDERPEKRQSTGSSDSPPSWLGDVSLAAQYLARLSMESSAQAALIVSKGSLWAYAGELPKAAAEELSDLASGYWEKNGGSDLVRFVRLGAASGEYMIYATSLGWDMLLAMVFDVETPFSKIRSQAARLAEKLSRQPEPEDRTPSVESSPVAEDDEEEDLLVNLPPLIEDVPPPTVTSLGEGWNYIDPKDFSYVAAAYEAAPSGSKVGEEQLYDTTPLTDQLFPEASKAESVPQYFDEEFKPVVHSIYQLYYACVVIPRLPQHYLTGDLAANLGKWLQQLCLAYGWRLTHLTVRPDHLHWIAMVPPSTSPAYMLRHIRKLTSEYIFDEFPRLKRENPSGDFWAPGYLVTSSIQPISGKVVRDFIALTRNNQGASSKKTIF
jgi:putative transposase